MTQPAPAQPAPKPRHVPERTCVACRRKAPQSDFVRLSRNQQGLWQVRQGGRGVYVCRNAMCWQEKRLRRSFGAQAARVSELLSQL